MDTTPCPQTLMEAIRYFDDPDACLNFLIPLRWPDGIACPRCESREHSFLSTRRLWKCKACKKQFSIKVGTIMEDTAIGLDKWLAAIWLIANAKNGVSSWEVHRSPGITQKSAWFLLHRVRMAMQTGTFRKLSGEVEVDETFIGGKARNMHKGRREESSKDAARWASPSSSACWSAGGGGREQGPNERDSRHAEAHRTDRSPRERGTGRHGEHGRPGVLRRAVARLRP